MKSRDANASKKTLNLESKTSDENLKSVNGDGVEGGIRSGWDRPGHVGEGVRCSGEQVGGKHTGWGKTCEWVKSHSRWGKTHKLLGTRAQFRRKMQW